MDKLWPIKFIFVNADPGCETFVCCLHKQVETVTHLAPTTLVLYFTGATNILYTFGRHAVTVSPTSHHIALIASRLSEQYIFLKHFSWRLYGCVLNRALKPLIILIVLITTVSYMTMEKLIEFIRVRSCTNYLNRGQVVVRIDWGSKVLNCTPAILRCKIWGCWMDFCCQWQIAIEKPPFFIPSWTAVYVLNFIILVCTIVVGIGWGGWTSTTNFLQQVYTFDVLAPCKLLSVSADTISYVVLPRNSDNTTIVQNQRESFHGFNP